MKLDYGDISFIQDCFRKWLTIREDETGQGVGDDTMQFLADMDHSDLLYRLLSGEEPRERPQL
jgi:hypothetical protein